MLLLIHFNYAHCTIDVCRLSGIVAVPDKRLDKLAEIWQTNKKTPAIVEFVDIAGLVKGASQGAGLGNKFLGHIRECDAIVHVVRCFDDDNIIHVVEDVTKAEAVDPIADIDAIDYELILSDLEVVQNRAGRMAKAAKSGNNKGAAAEAAWLQQLAAHLESGKPARSFDFDENDAEQQTVLHEMGLLSAKPVLYACNVGEDDLMEGIENNKYVPLVAARAKEEGARYIPICAKTEEDIADYSPEEKKAFLAEMGIEASGLDNLITASYDLLGLISFLTDGKKECRAWTIRKGTKAPQASSAPASSPTATSRPTISITLPSRPRACSAPRARNMSSRTAMSSSSCSMCKTEEQPLSLATARQLPWKGEPKQKRIKIMIIGIMGAMPDEVDQLCAKLENVTVEPYGGVEYHKGTLAGKQVVVCCAGMGKANAAATTQVLITKFGAEKIIFSGIAGNMTSKIGIGDVVIGKTVLYHDAQLDMICQNPPFLKEYTGDPALIAAAEKACADAGVKALAGKIATGDMFVGDSATKAAIEAKCAPDCVEMEGAAVSQIAAKNDVPCVILRAMSDNADEDGHEVLVVKKFSITEYVATATKIVAAMVESL